MPQLTSCTTIVIIYQTLEPLKSGGRIMEDFGVDQNKIGEGTQKVVDRAVEEAYRRESAFLTNEHIFIAFTQVEWTTFSEVMKDLKLDPYKVLKEVENHVKTSQAKVDKELRIAPATKLALKLALHQANRAGRQIIEPSDLFLAIFEEGQGVIVSVMRRNGIDVEVITSRISIRIRDNQLREESLRKRFELPPFLKYFATNINLLARQDKIPPVYGRDKEIQQVLEILCHRERPNSVMLIGEPGVGKTAIVEGLARKIEFEPETIPTRLRNCQIVNVQMNTMVAGTQLRGMFEERIQHVIRDIKEKPHLILFIDEAHTMVGAGSALGAPSDAANVFKSVLSRGEVRIIAATTLNEYKQHIQEDEALARRFRTVQIDEPTIEETRRILFKMRSRLEHNYSVNFSDESIETALELSPRYQRHLRLPDKVIGWLDTAAVRVEIAKCRDVTTEHVIQVIAHATGIPEDMIFRDVGDRFKSIEQQLSKRIIGQKKAIKALANRLILNKGPLKDGFDRPDGVLLFLGPTGVGKTELAKAVAEFLFGDDKKIIRIDMSEYQDGSVSENKLIGMPRGIIGSERGGVLTNQLKDNPCSVVLLDEIEKASPSVLNLFLQAFDEGWLTDGQGKRVYLSDSIIIMTSNAGSGHFRKLTNPTGFRSGPVTLDQIQSEINRELERRFSPEFRNRIDEVVTFQPLTKDEVFQIALKYIDEITATLKRWNKSLKVDLEALEKIVADGYSVAYGARFLKRVIDNCIKLPLSQRWKEANSFRVTLVDSKVMIKTNGPELAVVASPDNVSV